MRRRFLSWEAVIHCPESTFSGQSRLFAVINWSIPLAAVDFSGQTKSHVQNDLDFSEISVCQD
jgi:hypothetical protein